MDDSGLDGVVFVGHWDVVVLNGMLLPVAVSANVS